jgi:hypothetical protein
MGIKSPKVRTDRTAIDAELLRRSRDGAKRNPPEITSRPRVALKHLEAIGHLTLPMLRPLALHGQKASSTIRPGIDHLNAVSAPHPSDMFASTVGWSDLSVMIRLAVVDL